jgi:serine/threonine-protein kinase
MRMSSPTWIGRSIGGRYQIDALLGQGGMSAVYRATDPNLRRTVAVKLIHPHLSSDPEFVRRFEQEAAAVAQLRHPNIIQVFDFNHDGEVYYMVLEFVAGETLQNRLRALHANGNLLPLDQAVMIVATVGEAVEYAHRRGMVHRDLKPANVMLDPHGQPILMDFGVAKMLTGTQHTATGAIVGTVAYMSPEQIRGMKVDERADIYSLGIMLYEMTAGRPPFEGDSAMTVMFKHVNEPPPDIGQFNTHVPAELKAVILKALEKEPPARFQSAAELTAALRGLKLLRTAVTPPAPATVVTPARPVAPTTPPAKPEPAPSEKAAPAEAAAPVQARQEAPVETAAPAPAPKAAPTVVAAPAPVTSALAPPRAVPTATAAPDKRGGLPIALIAGAAAVVLILIVGVGFVLSRGQNTEGRATQTAPAPTQAVAAASSTAPITAVPPTLAPTQPPPPATALPASPTPAPAATTAVPTPEPTATQPAPTVPEGMVLIPAGSFQMGSDRGQADERPVHAVTLKAFFLDQFEVTNERYRKCVEAGPCRPPAQRSSFTRANYATLEEFNQYPVIQVSWEQAQDFCRFEGKRLPSEAEWEYAARGETDRRYPWGDQFEPARVPAFSRDTVQVGTLDNASPFGVFDLSGNVNEWVADWYARIYNPEQVENPTGPDSGARRVYRGGSFDNADGSFYTATRRYNQLPGYRDADIGFRCAADVVR